MHSASASRTPRQLSPSRTTTPRCMRSVHPSTFTAHQAGLAKAACTLPSEDAPQRLASIQVYSPHRAVNWCRVLAPLPARFQPSPKHPFPHPANNSIRRNLTERGVPMLNFGIRAALRAGPRRPPRPKFSWGHSAPMTATWVRIDIEQQTHRKNSFVKKGSQVACQVFLSRTVVGK